MSFMEYSVFSTLKRCKLTYQLKNLNLIGKTRARMRVLEFDMWVNFIN